MVSFTHNLFHILSSGVFVLIPALVWLITTGKYRAEDAEEDDFMWYFT